MGAGKEQLQAIYDDFEKKAAAYKREAACRKGCAFCCSDAGRIDITTAEGLVIRELMITLPRSRQVVLKKALTADMKRRERRQSSTCPLLMKNRACAIYAARPFACRRIYSLKACSLEQHPILSRQVMDLGDAVIRKLQKLDNTGYSGHLSYILHMLDTPAFLATYLAGDCRPEAVMQFGKSHGIVINRMVISAEPASVRSSA